MHHLINPLILLITLILTLQTFCRDGVWSLSTGWHRLRYFTIQSNILCAAGALALWAAPESGWAWGLKYVGTAAVTVTMLTVLLFLGPTSGNFRALLTGRDLFMHLITPVLALVSFCGFERRGLDFPGLLTGMIPVAVYGAHYTWRILLAPPEQAWEDFYGFNRGGHWRIAMGIMFLGTLLICLALAAVQNMGP